MSEQMRAEFSKHCQLWRYSEEVDENDFFINVTTQRAWDVWVTAWQASRQALVVELPELIDIGIGNTDNLTPFGEGMECAHTELIAEIGARLDKAGVSYR